MEAWEKRINDLVNQRQSELDALPDFNLKSLKRKKVDQYAKHPEQRQRGIREVQFAIKNH